MADLAPSRMPHMHLCYIIPGMWIFFIRQHHDRQLASTMRVQQDTSSSLRTCHTWLHHLQAESHVISSVLQKKEISLLFPLPCFNP